MTRHVPYGSYKGSMPKLVNVREKEAFRALETSACRIWNGRFGENNYPTLKNGKSARRRIWQEKYGKIPKHFIVYMSCGTNGCVNFRHMFLEGYHRLEKI